MTRTIAARSPRRLVALLAVLSVAAAASIAGAAPAQAADGTMSGTVTVDSVAQSDVTVEAFSATDSDVSYAVATNGLGQWSMSIPEGSYQVQFRASAGAIAVEWFSALVTDAYTRTEAQVITVGSSPVTAIDVDLVTGFTVAGTTTAEARVTPFRVNTVLDKYEQYGVPVFADGSGDFVVRGLAPGDYLFRVGPGTLAPNLETLYVGDGVPQTYIASANPLTITADVTGLAVGALSPRDQTVTRLGGAGRFDTSADIAAFAFGPGTTPLAFIVSGRNFPDALSAGPIAGLSDAPVLLTEPTSLPSIILDVLLYLEVSSIIIVGGPASVSTGVEQTLIDEGFSVQRIQGANRYETSQNLASVFYGLDAAPVSYVATGTNFPDALAAGPAAANNGGPVILVPGSSTSADGNTLDLLADLQTQHVVIAGGTAGVSNSYATSLLTPSMPWIGRAAGTNRYETSFLLNTTSFELADTVYLATGTNFPDALSGAAVASTDNYQGPIFLTPSNCVRGDVLTAIEFYQPKDIILLGGTATLSVAVESLTPC